MDLSTTSMEGGSKKVPLEDCSKEDLIKKCRKLLTLAQNAKHAKDLTNEENNKLKHSQLDTNEIIENLTQQKLALVTNFEDLKNQRKLLDDKLTKCEDQLYASENKIADLDTENQSFKRQLVRLTDENEQLLTHLDGLEKQIEELNKLGMEQQQQLLVLEKNNSILEENAIKEANDKTSELQKMLGVSLEELKKLKEANNEVSEKFENAETLLKEKDISIIIISQELTEKSNKLSSLEIDFEENSKKLDELQLLCNELQNNSQDNNSLKMDLVALKKSLSESAEDIQVYQQQIDVKDKEIEQYTSQTDDLNTEIHKNRALIQKLNQDISTMQGKLNENQIVSSGLNSDLQNTNERMKEKLKLYHSKIVKLVVDIKKLKEVKDYVLEHFKAYNEQAKIWKEQLVVAAEKLNQEIIKEKLDKEILNNSIKELKNELESLKDSTAEINVHKLTNEQLNEKVKHLETELVSTQGLLEESTNYKKDNYQKMKQLEAELESTKNNYKAENIEAHKKIEDLESELLSLKSLFELESTKNENDYKAQNIESNKKIEDLESELLSLKSLFEEIISYNIEKNILNERLIKLEEGSNTLAAKFKIIGEEFFNTAEQLETEKTKYSKLEQRYSNELSEKIVYNDIEEQLKQNKIENDKLQAKNKHLEAELEKSKSTESRLADESGQEILKLVQESKDMSDELMKLRNIIKDNERKTPDIKNELPTSDWDEKINSLKRENAELLTEMNEMNQALKERGETISQQQAYCDEVLKKISVYETQANKNVDIIAQHEDTINRLEEEIRNKSNDSLENKLRNEIALLKAKEEMLEKQLEGSCNTDNKVLMESEIKVEQLQKEISNLKQKLELQSERKMDEKLSNEKYEELEELKAEIAALKDRSMDISYAESDTMSTSTISRTEECNRLKDLEGSWEERYGKLRTLAIKLKGKIRELTTEIVKEQSEKYEIQQKLGNTLKNLQTIQTQSDKIHDELDICKKENKANLKKLDNLASEISKDKKQLADNDETLTKLRTELDVLNKEKSTVESWKKQVSLKVQSLKKELEANTVLKKDYEQRIQKLNLDLEAKDKILKQEMDKHAQTKNSLQESTNDRKKQSVLNLEMQDYERSIKEISQKLERKNELITKLKNQIDSQKSTVNAAKEQIRLLEERTITLETELEAYRIEVNMFKKSESNLETIITDKDFKIQDVLRTLENTRSENEELSTQLSKAITEHQKTNNSLRNEKDHFRNHNLGLEQRLREVEESLKLREDELNNIQSEYQGYKVRAQSVLRQNQTRDIGLEEKLTEEGATLRAQVDILKAEVHELKSVVDKLTSENHSISIEREQLESQRRDTNNEIEEKKRDYEKLTTKYQQTLTEHAESVRGLKVHAETLSQCYRQQISEQEVRHNREIIELQSKIEKSSTPPEIPTLIIPSTPREEGEGSESVDSINGNVHPLEKILGGDTDQEISFIRKQLNDNESKVTHLAALLADTEQDLAKHVQMNKVLKEEIRRQQRSVEREKHAENLEYMKNVVFKFITLNNGDERTRLIPVLNTILKLSPEECQKLSMVAKGDRSWSNYLPLWSSTNKPQ